MMEDEIIALLKNSKLRAEISQVMTEIYKWAGTFYDDPGEHLKTVAEEDLFNEAWEDAQLPVEGDGDFYDLFHRYVFNKIPVPHRIHFNEVLELLFDMAKPDARSSLCHDSEYADSAYTSFLNYVNNRVLLYRYSAPFPVCTILGGETTSVGMSWTHQTIIVARGGQDSVPNGKKHQEIYEGTLWGNDAGVCLNLVGKGRFESRYKGSFHVMTQITGRMSETVWKELSEEFKRILPSMWRSVKMLGKTWGMWERGPTIVDWVFANIDESNLPVISEADFDGGIAFVQKCLDAYFSTPTKKDTFDRRIRNAVHLLIASDAQSNGAVGLALSVTAIEALLGQKGGDISHRLADNVAALLEPELPRRQRATEFAKGLYDKRSRVLHGEVIEDGDGVRLKGRQLAAEVLHSMITYRDFLKAGGFDPQTPQEFLKALHETRFEPGQPAGLLESNVRELWR
ncbi:MAG: hypothetical protein ABIF19_09550 [Planctomycetota bacterium]